MTVPIAETHLKVLLDEATDLIHLVTPSGIILYANLSWQRALEQPLEDIVGRSIYDFVEKEGRHDFISLRKGVIEDHASHVSVNTRFVSKSGRSFPVEGFTSCHLENKKVIYTHSILRDVTKRNEEERKVKDSYALVLEREQNFGQLIQHAPDAIVVINAESEIQLWNPKSEAIFGWTSEEVKGKLLGDAIIPPQYREMHYLGVKRYLATGEARMLNKTIEITALHRSGDEFDIALTISQMAFKSQILFIAFIRDISEQKKMAKEIILQKQQLENTNEELAQYASLASHDLKEPIRKIQTFCDLLERPEKIAPSMSPGQLVTKIHAAANRMAALVNSIGQFSKIAIATSIGDYMPFNVQEVLDEVLSDLEEGIAIKKAVFIIEEFPSVRADRLHIYQVFENLIANSLKYSRPDVAPVIEISAARDKEGYTRVTFTDNGIGFSNAFADKVFQPFQRLHGKSYEGTGIGLSICKKIIESYGGTIGVSSVPDNGSTFSFTLPV